MLMREYNQLHTQTGPGTPMGEFMRRYWMPAMLSSELEADGEPKHIRLLSQDFVAFRDTAGASRTAGRELPASWSLTRLRAQ